MLEALFAGIGVLLTFALLIVLTIKIVIPSLSPGYNAADGLAQGILAWLAATLYTLPIAASAAGGAISNHFSTSGKYYLLALIVAVFSYGWMAEQNTILKAYDAYETEVAYPFNNEVLLPSANVLRLFYSGTIGWMNIGSGVSRYVRWAILLVAYDCPEYSGDATRQAIAAIPVLPVHATRNYILSGFSGNLDIGPTMNAIADTMSTFQPMMKCQCEAIYPIFPMLLDDNYGIFQSSRLHGVPDVALNLFLELPAQFGKAIIDIIERIGGICDLAVDTRECHVTRAPNFDRSADLTCTLVTHTTDLMDDAVNAVLMALGEDPWNVVLPWPNNPRVFGMAAMPVCLISDNVFLALDTAFHIDLFFTLAGNNYAREILYERPVSRLYNMTNHIQGIGDDLGVPIASDLACVIARLWNLLVGVIDVFFGMLREILAVDFNLAAFRLYLDGGTLSGQVAVLKSDAIVLGECVERVGDRLGHGLQSVFNAYARFGALLVELITDVVKNGNNILPYLSSTMFENTVNEMFLAANIGAAGMGGAVRQLGAFGSVECTIRNLTETPTDLDVVRDNSMHLNIMCALGTSLEMDLRMKTSMVQYAVNVLVAFFQSIADFQNTDPGPVASIQVITKHFREDGVLDLAREDGLIEHACMLGDAYASVLPSLINLPHYVLVCPGDTGLTVAEVLWTTFRSFTRMFVAPFHLVNIYIRAFGVFGDAASLDFEESCKTLLVPYWSAVVAPSVQIALSGIDIARCAIPGGGFDDALGEIGTFTGEVFIDTSYVSGYIDDCSEISDADGGHIVDGLCSFLGTSQSFLQFLVDIVKDGHWQALWNLIAAPLSELLESLIGLFTCLWNNVLSLLGKFGECAGALVAIDRFVPNAADYLNGIESGCGDWDDVFTECSFTLDIETYDIDDVYPPFTGGVGGPPVRQLIHDNIRGSCCAADSCVGPHPIYESGDPNGGDRPQTVEDCSTALAGTSVGVFIPGKTCPEQNVCDDVTTNASGVGACCFSGPTGGGNCQDITHAECEAAAILSGLETGAFVLGERCSSLDSSTCDLRFSPNSRQKGCCVRELDAIDPFQDYIKRQYDPDVSGNECYLSQQSPGTHRAYYIPGDVNCAVIQSTEGDAFINGSDTTIYDAQSCIPDDELKLTGTAQRSRVFLTMSSACRVANDGDGASIVDPLAQGSLYTPYPYYSDPVCNWLTVGRSYCCLRSSESFTFNLQQLVVNLPGPPALLNKWFSVNDILNSPNPKTYPFADFGIADTMSLGQKQQALLADFEVLGLSGGACDYCADGGTCDDDCALPEVFTTTVIGMPEVAVDFPVIRIRPLAATSPVISYPQYGAIPDPAADNLAYPKQAMMVLYHTNTTEMSLPRGNMDRHCQVFFYPDIPLPPLARRRRDIWNPRPSIARNAYSIDLNSPSHPCHLVYTYMNMTVDNPPLEHLIRKDYRECMSSDVRTHALDYLLFSRAGERVIHPHFFYDTNVQAVTWFNVSRAIGAVFRHSNAIFKAEETNQTLEVPRRWVDYAESQNVTDLLGIRLGHLISIFANKTVALRRLGKSVPFWMLPFQVSAITWKSYFTGGNGTRRNITQPLEAAPALSDAGLALWDDIWNFNWITFPNSTYNATGLRGIRASLAPMIDHPLALMNDGLVLRNISYHPRAGVGGGSICDPRDTDCLKCRVLAESATVIVDHILNVVEDLEDTKRFSLNVTALDLLRTNTFEQESDPRTCDNATLKNFENIDPMGIGTWIVDTFQLRDFLGRMVCYLTNTDNLDPQSPVFWFEKLIFCDAAIDGSCHRGRAGIGLWPAVLWVTIIFASIAIVSTLFLPFIPAAMLFGTVWVLAVPSVAYFWSPSCIIPSFPIPLPVLPDCLADDLYFTLQNFTEGNCRDYGEIFGEGGGNCTNTGRDFPECSADPLNFDMTGFRNFFYVLDLVPGFTEFLDTTNIPLVGWIRYLPYVGRAIHNVHLIRGTPQGDFCFWANSPSLIPLFFMLLGLVTIILILTGLIFIVGFLAVGFVALAMQGMTALINLLARRNIDISRFYILKRH